MLSTRARMMMMIAAASSLALSVKAEEAPQVAQPIKVKAPSYDGGEMTRKERRAAKAAARYHARRKATAERHAKMRQPSGSGAD